MRVIPRIIRCSVHGKVEGFFCRECLVEKYVEEVKNGKIRPRPLPFVELERPARELSLLQIRYRAYHQRNEREIRRSNSSEVWKRRPRVTRIISTQFLKGI